jgi:hypothetical protein
MLLYALLEWIKVTIKVRYESYVLRLFPCLFVYYYVYPPLSLSLLVYYCINLMKYVGIKISNAL